MNYKFTLRLLGIVSLCEGALLLAPMILSAVKGEDWLAFVNVIAIAVVVGLPLALFCKPQKKTMRVTGGLVSCALCWIVMSVIGCLPFVLSNNAGFIDALFEKKKRYALVKRTKLGAVITVLAIVIMLSCVMLISNQFEYGMLVVATESMTGEINKGDAVIYQRYDDEVIIEGQVIVFDKNGSKIIHRVDKIEIIDGVARYYTKGDANDDIDSGYITKSNVVGLVGYKIPYIGYPTIWLRSLFKR